MILEQSYQEEWINDIVEQYPAANYGLAEKMIYAFTLLEQLALRKLSFIFKGGTALALLLPELHRFSKDIDILMEEKPGKLEEHFDTIIANSPFTRWEPSPRDPEFDVPKEHFKFYYNLSNPGKFQEEPILLDILYGPSTYPRLEKQKIKHSIIKTEGPITEVKVPTIEGITGDKLTAFAPHTLGIPFGKNKSVEIVKQLYDIQQLMGHCEDWKEVNKAFVATAQKVNEFYKMDVTSADVIDDVVETAITFGMQGKINKDEYTELKRGIDGLNNYLLDTKITIPEGISAAAMIARLALCLKIEKEFSLTDWLEVDKTKLKDINLTHDKLKQLNKPLKKGYPEAWYEWVLIQELIT